jgi:putative ABC transport system substrate-binding protein
MRKVIIGVLLVVIGVVGFLAWRTRAGDEYHVSLVSIVEIDPITQLREGFRAELDSSGFARGTEIRYTEYNAQGDANLINQVVDQVIASEPDLVYVLGTPIAQALQNRNPNLLIVQGAVTDPVAAGLANAWSASGKRYVATSDLPPIPKQVALIRELTPAARRLGVIYNPGEANSVAVVSRLKDQIRLDGAQLTIVERSIGSTAEVPTALNSLIGNVDALYIPPDNTAHGAMQLIGQFAGQHRLPLYTTVPESLDQGALAAVGLDFRELGRESARLALRVVADGADPASQPILVNDNPEIHISAAVANALGINLAAFSGRPKVLIRQRP